jgi:glycosidase
MASCPPVTGRQLMAIFRPRSGALAAAIGWLAFCNATAANAAEPIRPLEDEIIYVVIVQKFCNGDVTNDIMAKKFAGRREEFEGGFWGGDLAGIQQKLDYFVDLGVTSLLLYPVMENDRRPAGRYLATGYRPRDYFHVDENFGDMAQLKALIDDAHRRGLRVILDMPLGMPGYEYPELAKLEQQGWLGAKTRYGMRQWNVENPQAADFLIRVAKFWRDESGCDGFRLDSAHFHKTAFWKRFVHEMKSGEGHEHFLVLAELPVALSEIDESLSQAEFDGAYDFDVGTARDVFGRGASVDLVASALRNSQQQFHAPRSMLAQLDDYEDPAFMDTAQDDKAQRMLTAMTFLLTLNRVPLIYPGDERAVLCRRAGDLFTDDRKNSRFFQQVKRLIAVRKSEPALRRGRFLEVKAQHPIYAYLRGDQASEILAVFNVAADSQIVRFDIDGLPWKECRLADLVSGDTVKTSGDEAAIQVDALKGYLFRVERTLR